MWKYYKIFFEVVDIRGLVRLHDITVEHYDGKEVWNANWSGARQAYMDIIGMGGFWHLYHEINVEEVEEIKHVVDEKFKKGGVLLIRK